MDEILDDISDKIFLENLRTEFLISIENYVTKLSEFFITGNYTEIRKIAHDIKGISGVFGFDKASELAAELIKHTDSGDKKKIRDPYLNLVNYLTENVLEKSVEEK